MAISRFSTPFQISRPISVVNEELYDNIMHEKQSAYDEGYLNIQKSLQSYNALDLVKPEDIAYRDKKVAELTDKLDGYGNVDLSDPKEVIRLQTEAAGLSKDKELMSMVSSTANYRQLVDRYSKLKENPKLIQYYDPANEYADMKQVEGWLNGTSKGLSIRTPTLKTDVDKIAQNQFKNMKPTAYSYVNGMYIVNGEMLSEGDLSNAGLNLVQGDSNVQAQLMRNADFTFRDATPEQMYNIALSNKVDMIADARNSLNNYENQLKDASLDANQKASINNKISQLKQNIIQQEESYKDISAKYNRGDVSDLNNLKYEVYANRWIKSQVTPFIVNREKISPNNVAIAAMREDGANKRFNTRMEFDAGQNALNREFQLEKAKIQNSKIGKNTTGYDANGNIIVSSQGVFQSLPAIQPDNEINAYSEINNSVNNMQKENRRIIAGYTQKVLEDTDPILLSKIKPLLDNGNLFENGKFLGDKTGLSQAQIDLLSQYDELLDNAIDPNFIKNSKLIPQYGSVINDINVNQMKWTQLQDEKAKAIKKVFNDAWSKGEFKGTWEQFNDLLNNQSVNINNSGMKQFGNVGATVPDFSAPDFIKQVNAELNKSTIKNEFLTARVVGEKDEIYNNPELAYHGLVEETLKNKGVYINGKLNSINGNIMDGVSYGEDIPNYEKMTITGIIPNTDQVRVNISYKLKPDDKESVTKTALVQMTPDEMKQLTGRDSQTYDPTSNFQNYLINGQMQDKEGKPMWFNLNGDVPNMLGNLQYRVWSFNKGKLRTSVRIPTPNGVQEMMLPIEVEGENALRSIKVNLSQLYINTRQQKIAENPKLSPEEIHKITLEEIYTQINKNK